MCQFALLQVAPSVNLRIGGPAISVPGLAGALAREGIATCVASLDYPEHGGAGELGGARYLNARVSPVGRLLRGWSPALKRLVKEAAREADIVHSHALWMVPGIYARQAAEEFGRPLVISPRGMLDRWSLDRSRLRKCVAAALYENRNLRAASLLHATSDLEAESVRRYGLRQPIVVLPNGIELPATADLPAREVLESRFPEIRGKRWLLFLGRLDPKKGLDLLLALWRELGPRYSDWSLIVAGPDLEGYGAKMVSAVSSDPEMRSRTTFTGMLEGAEKSAALAHSELFVLPTRGENFGIAVAEALAHGTPVITTTAAPWEDLVRSNCGWWVAPEAGAVKGALESAMRLPAAALARMGSNGVALVREQFSWDSIGPRWVEVYRWLLSGGPPPACVRLE
ncbi:MAG: glycosyltransferase [Thermoanaerobaculia bacterium]